jgi:N-acetylneuraminic acid mutarotase
MDSDGTFAYEGGGYSFSVGGTVNQFGRFDPVANTWTPLAPVPDLSNAEASGVYASNVNKLFVFGGDDPTTGIVVNTTRIYDIATNTWSTGAPMPDVRAFMASGYFNGKIYLVGGYSTGNVDPSFGQVWEYDPVTNTFNTSRTSMPATLGGPGFGVINGHLYVAGGRDINNTNLSTLYDYDIATDTCDWRKAMDFWRW